MLTASTRHLGSRIPPSVALAKSATSLRGPKIALVGSQSIDGLLWRFRAARRQPGRLRESPRVIIRDRTCRAHCTDPEHRQESDGHEDFLHDSNSKSAKRRNSSRCVTEPSERSKHLELTCRDRDMETRKAQNRQAQRDFRQRKQQYVKDLEAKLELYSATHDDQVESLRRAMHML